MDGNSGFGWVKEERKNLGFFKVFQSANLSSESMRAFPYDFITRVSKNDFSDKMVIKAQWGTSWDVEISKNPRFYYMEKRGWDQFVSDNGLGDKEFVTFIHKGKMIFNVHIYEDNGSEMLIARKSMLGSFSQVKKEQGESSLKDVKKEDETGESPRGVQVQVRKKKTENFKSSNKKMNSVKLETGESSRGAELKVRKRKDEDTIVSKKKKIKSNQEEDSSVPEFEITITKSYLRCLPIPRKFVNNHIPNKSKYFTIHHPNGTNSWKVLSLVREIQTTFSYGYSKLARQYPLSVGDVCTFKLIKPLEFLLLVVPGEDERADSE